jgi:hypothetical protein
MQVAQIYNLVNTAAQAVSGEITLPTEDLTNLVDVGKSIANAVGYEPFYKALVNRIGKMYFVDRKYKGLLFKIFKDSWQFGSIVGKVQVDDMQYTENDTWQIINGASYDPYVVNLPIVSAKFFNKMATFELDITTPTIQIEQSFTSADEMNRFLSMVQTMVYNSMETAIEACAFRCLDNMIAATIDGAGARVVHLVTVYNGIAGTSLTASTALLDKAFCNWAAKELGLVKKRLASRTVIYNIGGKRRFTPAEDLHVVALADFAEAVKNVGYGNTYHKEFVELPNYEEVPYWQAPGTGFAWSDISTVDVTAIVDDAGTTKAVKEDNICCVMFDDNALGVLQPRRRVTTQYNPKIEAYTDFWKWESRYFNDFNEQAVVFILD